MTDAVVAPVVAAVVDPTIAAAVVVPPVADATKPADATVVVPAAVVPEKADLPLDAALWGSTGDAVGDSTLSLMQNAGITPADAKALVYDAIAAGDINKIDKAALISKVGKDKATLIIAGAENFITRSTAKANVILTDVHTAVGGKDNWASITAWAKASVPEAEIADYRNMIDAGGAQARFAANELVSRFNADSKNTTLSAKAAEITPSSTTTSAVRATSRAEYAAELTSAHRNKADAAKFAEITAARHAGRALGK